MTDSLARITLDLMADPLFELSDIFIGDFAITQAFGARPEVYSARYGLRGHNGTDFGAPSLTQILSTADGWVSEIGFDAGGYGKYIKVVHQGYLSIYAHLNDIIVNLKDKVVSGQLLGHSNNTGFSDAPHLHFGVAPCDLNGLKTDPTNGFSGYIDPMGPQCHWTIKNPTEPINPQTQTAPPISVSSSELSIKSVQANNFVTIVNFGMQNGLGVFLSNSGKAIDLVNAPADPTNGEKVNEWISSILQQNAQLVSAPPKAPDLPDLTNIPSDQKNSLLQSVGDLYNKLKGLIFTQK